MYSTDIRGVSTTSAVSNVAGLGETLREKEESIGRWVANTGSGHISEKARQLNESESVYRMATGGGEKDIDLDTYFSPDAPRSNDLFDIDSLLLPSSQNVAAIQEHINKKMPSFLAKNNIPEAPEFIRYDGHGKMVLPEDYAYADQFREAIESDPGLGKALSTVNALASHLAALKELEPFNQEMEAAESQAQIKAIIEKYSHLLSDNRSYPEIQLSFNDKGQLSVKADGSALV